MHAVLARAQRRSGISPPRPRGQGPSRSLGGAGRATTRPWLQRAERAAGLAGRRSAGPRPRDGDARPAAPRPCGIWRARAPAARSPASTATCISARSWWPTATCSSSTSRASRPSRWNCGAPRTARLRDVAGMLRSFDYAAAVVRRQKPREPGASAGGAACTLSWTASSRGQPRRSWRVIATVAHGRRRDAGSADQALLDLFLIEKAAYEIAYEAANRPTWIDVPLRGLARLADASARHRRLRRE